MKKTLICLLLIMGAYIVTNWFYLNYVMTPETIEIIYGEGMYDQIHQFSIFGYFLTVISVIIRVVFYALVVYVGYCLFVKQPFMPILQSVVVAEGVNVLAAVMKALNEAFINPPTTLLETEMPVFSLLSFFDINKLDQWMVKPLTAVNIFEVLYILVLSYILSKNLKQSYGTSCKVVLCSCGLVKLLIVIGLTVFTLYATR